MKKLIHHYTFSASARTVTLTDYVTLVQEGMLVITNVTTGTMIFNFASPALGGTVAGNVLTLTHDTSAMSNSDVLQIWYDDPTIDAATSQGVAVLKGSVDAGNTSLASILTKLADPATQTTLAAVLAKLSADPSTATGVTAVKTSVDALKTSVDAQRTLFQQVQNAADNVTTITYTDSTKSSVASIAQVSATVGHTATETFNSSGSTTLVITRAVP